VRCGDCPEGYAGDGESGCHDIDECAVDNGGCDPLTVCDNEPGSFSCGPCPSRYRGDGVDGCEDIDECETNNGGCGDPEYTRCLNRAGHEPRCEDIDECAANNGDCGSPTLFHCVNVQGAPPLCNEIESCDNNNGGCGDPTFWSCLMRDETTACEDVDECEIDNGGCGSTDEYTCTNIAGAPPTCLNVGACDDEPCGTGGTCVPEREGYTCECDDGYDQALRDGVTTCVMRIQPSGNRRFSGMVEPQPPCDCSPQPCACQ